MPQRFGGVDSQEAGPAEAQWRCLRLLADEAAGAVVEARGDVDVTVDVAVTAGAPVCLGLAVALGVPGRNELLGGRVEGSAGARTEKQKEHTTIRGGRLHNDALGAGRGVGVAGRQHVRLLLVGVGGVVEDAGLEALVLLHGGGPVLALGALAPRVLRVVGVRGEAEAVALYAIAGTKEQQSQHTKVGDCTERERNEGQRRTAARAGLEWAGQAWAGQTRRQSTNGGQHQQTKHSASTRAARTFFLSPVEWLENAETLTLSSW